MSKKKKFLDWDTFYGLAELSYCVLVFPIRAPPKVYRLVGDRLVRRRVKASIGAVELSRRTIVIKTCRCQVVISFYYLVVEQYGSRTSTAIASSRPDREQCVGAIKRRRTKRHFENNALPPKWQERFIAGGCRCRAVVAITCVFFIHFFFYD